MTMKVYQYVACDANIYVCFTSIHCFTDFTCILRLRRWPEDARTLKSLGLELMQRSYEIKIVGPLPADLTDRVSTLHATAILGHSPLDARGKSPNAQLKHVGGRHAP